MTAGERLQLGQALDLQGKALEILERVDTRMEGFDTRLRRVEDYILVERTIDEAATKKKDSARLNRAQIITAVGIGGSFILGLINAVR